MLERDKEMKAMLKRVKVPAPSADLEARIIAAAEAGERESGEVVMGPSSWWQRHGGKMALAASVALAVLILFDLPDVQNQGQPNSKASQLAAVETPVKEERYAVHGMPLLVDVEIVDDEELELDYASL